MNSLSYQKMVSVSAGDNIEAFCAGFGIAAGTYALVALANSWNPLGWGSGATIATIGIACGAYALS